VCVSYNLANLNHTFWTENTFLLVDQACQIQTTLRAAKVTKSAKWAAKVMKNFSVGWLHLGAFKG
jgi:hypothetical protein